MFSSRSGGRELQTEDLTPIVAALQALESPGTADSESTIFSVYRSGATITVVWYTLGKTAVEAQTHSHTS